MKSSFTCSGPFALVFLLRVKGGKWLCVSGLLAVFAIAATSRTVGYVMHNNVGRNPFLSSYSFFSCWDAIAIGCALAFVLTKRPAWLALPRTYPVRWALVAALLILVPYVLERLFLLGIFTVCRSDRFLRRWGSGCWFSRASRNRACSFTVRSIPHS